MIKKISILLLSCCSYAAFSCGRALPVNDPDFCPSFKTAAICYCEVSLPAALCQDMHTLYNRMIVMFKTLDKACEFQRYTSKQDCIDNWRCYLAGGVSSQGLSCSSTQLPCE